MNTVPHIGDIAAGFAQAAAGELPLIEVIGLAQDYARIDNGLAAALYATWIAQAPPDQSGIIWYNLAVLLETGGANREAQKAYRNAATHMPTLALARQGLLRMLMLDSKRRSLRDGGADEALLLCRELLGGGINFRPRPDPAPPAEVLAYYAFLIEDVGWKGRAEHLYESYFAVGGENDFFRARLTGLARERQALRKNVFPLGDKRLRCLSLEIVDGEHVSSPMMAPELIDRCLDNLDVDIVETIRLYVRGEPLRHTCLLGVLAAIEGHRRGPVRLDTVEVWTDGHDIDMVQFEEALRCFSIDSVVVRCAGDGTPQGYRRPRPGRCWADFQRFLGSLASYRRVYYLDVALRAWVDAPMAEDRARWRDVLVPLGWEPEFAAGPGDAPPLLDGRPVSLEPGDGLTVAVDGAIGPGLSLAESRFSDIVARRPSSCKGP